MHQIKKDGRVVFTGTENECFSELLRIQPHSTDYAQRYGGYKIEPVTSRDEKPQSEKEATHENA